MTKNNEIRNENVRGSVKVTELSKKVRETGLRVYGHCRSIKTEFLLLTIIYKLS